MTQPLHLVLAATLAATPALAQPAPPRTRPLHDVAVTYRVEGDATALIPGGLPGPVTLSWDAGTEKLRAEAEGVPDIALLDLRDHAGQVFDRTLHIAIPFTVRADALQPLTLEGARLAPVGPETVAGLPCTLYRFTSSQGGTQSPGTVCLTQDGVPLRGAGTIRGRPGSFTATAVNYGHLPPELFAIPAGYTSLGGGEPGHGLSLKNLTQRFGARHPE